MKQTGKKINRIRLQVFLSHNGVSSRRGAMDIIKEGRVKLNGKMTDEPSCPVNPQKDRVEVDGKLIRNKNFDYILLNKKSGFIVTTEQRPTASNVFKLLPEKYQHLSAVGRLDKDTEGLLLFTNDGDTAYKLTHPKFNVDKAYFVRVQGILGRDSKFQLMNGIVIDGRRTSKALVSHLKSGKNVTEFKLTIHEGRKRQIRLMCDKVGHKVVYLKRISQGPLTLDGVAVGRWRELTAREIQQIQKIKIS